MIASEIPSAVEKRKFPGKYRYFRHLLGCRPAWAMSRSDLDGAVVRQNFDSAPLAGCGAKEHVVPGSAVAIRPRGCGFQLCRYRGKPGFRRSLLRPNARYRSICGLPAFHPRWKANGGTACSSTAASSGNSRFSTQCCDTTAGRSASRRCSRWNCRSNSSCRRRRGRFCRFSAMHSPSLSRPRILFIGSPCSDEGAIGLMPGIDRARALDCIQQAAEDEARKRRRGDGDLEGFSVHVAA